MFYLLYTPIVDEGCMISSGLEKKNKLCVKFI